MTTVRECDGRGTNEKRGFIIDVLPNTNDPSPSRSKEEGYIVSAFVPAPQ